VTRSASFRIVSAGRPDRTPEEPPIAGGSTARATPSRSTARIRCVQGATVRLSHSLSGRAVPSRNKEPRIRPSAVLVELGFALMRKATSLPVGRARAATLYRDGLMIALLTLRPIRLRNLAGLELGRTLLQNPAGWCITIPAEETKTHRKIEV
jgi:hypothetical protein